MFASYCCKTQKGIKEIPPDLLQKHSMSLFLLSQGWKQKCQELNSRSEPQLSLRGLCVHVRVRVLEKFV